MRKELSAYNLVKDKALEGIHVLGVFMTYYIWVDIRCYGCIRAEI